MDTMDPTRVLAYLRVSTTEQEASGAGLAAQRAAIGRRAEAEGWTVEWIIETGSAGSLRRPGLADALARLKAGEADALVVAKMDRLSRSLLDYARLIEQAKAEGWSLVALDSPADPTTPHGEAMAGVQAVFAQLERRLISQRTKEALAARKAAGVRLGRERLVAPEVEARVIALRASGLTLKAVGEALTAEGHHGPTGGTWHPSSLHRIVARA